MECSVSPIVAIEGLDGAGKNTLADEVTDHLRRSGVRVGRLAFPRYGHVHADLIADVLHGRLDGLVESPYAMATLFALDRRDALDDLESLRKRNDLVLLDRWVASSAAYTAARLSDAPAGDDDPDGDRVLEWVADLEFGRLGLPRPDLQVLLDTSADEAARRAASRENLGDRDRDSYERDAGLQHRTSSVYRRLADSGWASEWRVVTDEIESAALADDLRALSGLTADGHSGIASDGRRPDPLSGRGSTEAGPRGKNR